MESTNTKQIQVQDLPDALFDQYRECVQKMYAALYPFYHEYPTEMFLNALTSTLASAIGASFPEHYAETFSKIFAMNLVENVKKQF